MNIECGTDGGTRSGGGWYLTTSFPSVGDVGRRWCRCWGRCGGTLRGRIIATKLKKKIKVDWVVVFKKKRKKTKTKDGDSFHSHDLWINGCFSGSPSC